MYEETLHDLRVKYDNTFAGLVLPSGIRLPFFINEIFVDGADLDDEDMDPDEAEGVPASYASFSGKVYHDSDNFRNSWNMTFKGSELDFSWPQLGVIECQDSAVFGSRIADVPSPTKYRKTPGWESMQFADANFKEKHNLPDYETHSATYMPEYLYHAWNGQPYRSIEDAIDILDNGIRLGCSLSDTYSIHIDIDVEQYKVAREGNVIGFYFGEDGVVRFLNKGLEVYYEELSELGFNVARGEYVDDNSDDMRRISIEAAAPKLSPDMAHIIIDEAHNLTNLDWGVEEPDEPTFELENM